MNTVSLEGILARPAKRTGSDKQPIALFTVEVARENGRGKDWLDCKAYGRKALALIDAEPGAQISLHGELRSESWGAEGARRFAMKVQTVAITIDGVDPLAGDTEDGDPSEDAA